eukprot:10383934-Alexandrium_andersonii.AAC.1
MSTSSTSQPTHRSIEERPSFRWQGPEKRWGRRGAMPFAAGGCFFGADSRSGGKSGRFPSHFFCLPPPSPFWAWA